MTISNIIRPGDKIDISFAQNASRASEGQELPRIFKSQVLDIRENGNIEISMPSEAGKLILLPLGIRYEMVFFAKNGLYRAIGQIRERYKKDNVYMLEMEFRTQLEKYQRREFFRYPYLLDIVYYTITEEEAKMGSSDAIFIYLRNKAPSHTNIEYRGQVLDLSGGGIRFNVEQQIKPDQYILFEIHLENENVDKYYYIVGIVISCERIEMIQDVRYEARARFLIQDDNVREELIRFIFEEERRTRQRGRS